MSIEKPEVINQGSHFDLATLFGVKSLIIILYVNCVQTFFELVR